MTAQERIRAARHTAGISQQKMSDLLGIPKRTIEDWEVGRRSPDPWKLEQIIKALNDLTPQE